MKRLFFSGEVKKGGPLEHFCTTHRIALTAESLLKFEAVPFVVAKPFDVIFFSSIRSYNYFISQFFDLAEADLACVGKQTADKINEKNNSLTFVGAGAGDPEKVALDFKAWLGDRRVLFPVSRQSAGTIASVIPDDQREVVVCYETLLRAIEVPAHDFYVFTSPSNVDAFLNGSELPQTAAIIAWGRTTEKRLLEQGVIPKAVLNESTEEELVDVLKNVTLLGPPSASSAPRR